MDSLRVDLRCFISIQPEHVKFSIICLDYQPLDADMQEENSWRKTL